VTGHTGSTSRLWTLAQMEQARDFGTPMQIAAMERRRAILEAFAKRSFEARALVGGQIYGIDNGLKAMRGYLGALRDTEAMETVAKAERALKAKVAKDPKLKALVGQSWAQVQKSMVEAGKLTQEQMLVNARGSELLGIALHLVRLPQEAARPEGKRLPEYAEAALTPLKTRPTQPRPQPLRSDPGTAPPTQGPKVEPPRAWPKPQYRARSCRTPSK